MVCKLDLEKAYDHVNRNCLLNLLQLMNLGNKWIEWIKSCISTARFLVWINGSPKGYFKSQRGLRQGDALSPYLFVIVMEILSLMIKRAESLGWIKGFKIEGRNNTEIVISLILYADDTLILCEADREQLLLLRGIC